MGERTFGNKKIATATVVILVGLAVVYLLWPRPIEEVFFSYKRV